VDGCFEDVKGLAYWWSNCIQLRWVLWAMCRGDDEDPGDDGSVDEFDWVMQARGCSGSVCPASCCRAFFPLLGLGDGGVDGGRLGPCREPGPCEEAAKPTVAYVGKNKNKNV
jgi:hypothetical protein